MRREDRGEIMDTGGFIELDSENIEQFSQDVLYFISGKHIETIIGGWAEWYGDGFFVSLNQVY